MKFASMTAALRAGYRRCGPGYGDVQVDSRAGNTWVARDGRVGVLAVLGVGEVVRTGQVDFVHLMRLNPGVDAATERSRAGMEAGSWMRDPLDSGRVAWIAGDRKVFYAVLVSCPEDTTTIMVEAGSTPEAIQTALARLAHANDMAGEDVLEFAAHVNGVVDVDGQCVFTKFAGQIAQQRNGGALD